MLDATLAKTDRKLYSYALLKAFINEGQDYLDAFTPFVFKNLDTSYQSVESLRARIESHEDLSLPLHVLRTLLERLRQTGTVEKPHNAARFRLSKQGETDAFDEETAHQTERQINSLVADIHIFMGEKGLELTANQVRDQMLALMQYKIDGLVAFVSHEQRPVELDEDDTVFARHFRAYIHEAVTCKPDHYAILQQLILGAVLSWVLCTRTSEELEAVSEFEGCVLFIDTNLIFSILGLREQELALPAQELFKLMQRHGFKPKVFSFTLDEIVSVTNGYLGEGDIYTPTVRVDSIYSTMKVRHWGRADVIDFNTNLEERLKGFGIEVEHHAIKLDTYEPTDASRSTSIQKYKTKQGVSNRNHDLAALELVEGKRPQAARRPSEAGVFFLTADRGLHRFDQEELGHRARSTVGSVLLGEMLTSLLWLKDPSVELSIEAIVTAHAQDLLINRRVWQQFYKMLMKAREDGKLSDKALSALMFQGYLNHTLRDLTEEDTDEIDEAFVLERAEEAATKMEVAVVEKEKAVENERTRRETDLAQLHQGKEDEKQEAIALAVQEASVLAREEVHQEILSKTSVRRSKLRQEANRWGENRARRWVGFLQFLPLMAAGVYFGSGLLLSTLPDLKPVVNIFILIGFFGGQGISVFTSVWAWFEQPLACHLSKWKFRNSALNELEKEVVAITEKDSIFSQSA